MIFTRNLFIFQGYEESEVLYSNSVVWDIMNTCIIEYCACVQVLSWICQTVVSMSIVNVWFAGFLVAIMSYRVIYYYTLLAVLYSC